MLVLDSVSSSLFVKHISTSQHVGHVWLLFTSKNAVKLKYKRRRYVFVGFNRTHLIMLTISVIAAGQLNVNSWLSMSLRFIGIVYDFVSK